MEKSRAPQTAKFRKSESLVSAEISACGIAVALTVAISAFFDAPLDGPFDPLVAPTENLKAPWIFLGIQTLLPYAPPGIAGLAWPLLTLAVGAVFPWAPESVRGALALVFAIAMIVHAALVIGGMMR
jgi:hypothetical protein